MYGLVDAKSGDLGKWYNDYHEVRNNRRGPGEAVSVICAQEVESDIPFWSQQVESRVRLKAHENESPSH